MAGYSARQSRCHTDDSFGLLSKVLAGLDGSAGLRTVSTNDIQAMLNVERQKDLLGCDTAACMAEIGGALGAGLVLYGDLGVLGSQYVINLAVVGTRMGQVRARVSHMVRADDDDLAASVGGLVGAVTDKLLAEAQRRD